MLYEYQYHFLPSGDEFRLLNGPKLYNCFVNGFRSSLEFRCRRPQADSALMRSSTARFA
jgi:hypothetical protein